MPIIAVYRDAAGNILGGTNSGVEFPSVRGHGAIRDIRFPAAANVATTEVYWQLGRGLPQ